MTIAREGRRSRSRQSSEGFEIAIPAKQSVFLKVMLPPSLMVWGVRELIALAPLFLGNDDTAWSAVSTAGLIAWSFVGVFLFYLWFWMLIGTEFVILRSDTLLIRRELGGFDRSKAYDLQRIGNLRVDSRDRIGAIHVLGIGSGPVAFDYGSETVRFGTGVPEAEAQEIVNELRSRYPFDDPKA